MRVSKTDFVVFGLCLTPPPGLLYIITCGIFLQPPDAFWKTGQIELSFFITIEPMIFITWSISSYSLDVLVYLSLFHTLLRILLAAKLTHRESMGLYLSTQQ